MQARGMLMIEHRLIERMITVIRRKTERAQQTGSIAPHFIDAAVDFIRVYADRTHHGKEEDILFRALEKKKMSDDHRRVMNELIEEHAFGRSTTKAVVEANARYRNDDATALADVISLLNTLASFYPRHIKKEDEVFFPASQAYLSKEEDAQMIRDFWEFDRKMIHERYRAIVQGFESE